MTSCVATLRAHAQGREVAVGCVLAIILAACLVIPEPAAAFSLNPADWVVDGFKALLGFIFGDIDALGRRIVTLLLAVPLLTDHGSFPRLNDYRDYVTFGAWAVLALSFVIACLRYWLSSYSGSGAYGALLGFVRSAGAIAMLLMFPIMFDQVSRAVNAFTAALVSNRVVGSGLGNGVVTVLSSQSLSEGGIAMLIGIAAIIAAVILLVVKVVMTALLAVLYVASPLAIALWPIEELSWALRSLVQAIVGLLSFPILWALCFSTFAVLTTDALFPGDQGDVLNTILAPLIGLASLIIAFRLPFAVLNQAMKAGITPGINRTMVVARNVGGSARTRLRAGKATA